MSADTKCSYGTLLTDSNIQNVETPTMSFETSQTVAQECTVLEARWRVSAARPGMLSDQPQHAFAAHLVG